MENNVPVLFRKKEDCCGCCACFSVCPVGAITMVVDEEGFEYPNINETKCIRCHACLNVCPFRKIK